MLHVTTPVINMHVGVDSHFGNNPSDSPIWNFICNLRYLNGIKEFWFFERFTALKQNSLVRSKGRAFMRSIHQSSDKCRINHFIYDNPFDALSIASYRSNIHQLITRHNIILPIPMLFDFPYHHTLKLPLSITVLLQMFHQFI